MSTVYRAKRFTPILKRDKRFGKANLVKRETVSIPWVNPIKQLWRPLRRLKQAQNIAPHFIQYFSILANQTKSEKNAIFKLRHEVYCQELDFGFAVRDGYESDHYDEQSLFCLIQHNQSKEIAGAIRLVQSPSENLPLPVEVICDTLYKKSKLHPSLAPRASVCEISRLAVSFHFRRKHLKRQAGTISDAKGFRLYNTLYMASDIEKKCSSFIAIALYFAAAALAKLAGHEYVYVVVKPKLARSMRYVGIKFKKIGSEFEYKGRRAPYCAKVEDFYQGLPKGFKQLLNVIEMQISEQIPQEVLDKA